MNKFGFLTAIIAITFLLSPIAAHADTYTLDAAHSSIGFSVGHLMVSETRGEFTDYKGTIQFDPENITETQMNVEIEANSIDTRSEARDKHLRSPDFFDVEKFPKITFKSQEIVQSGDKYTIVGTLTIKGVTKKITIPAKIAGPVKSPFGAEVLGITGQTVINRQDFGVSWNKKLDQGGFVIDDEVDILISVEAHSKEE